MAFLHKEDVQLKVEIGLYLETPVSNRKTSKIALFYVTFFFCMIKGWQLSICIVGLLYSEATLLSTQAKESF